MLDMETALALQQAAPVVVSCIAILGVAWVVVTWMKIRHRYPLGGMFGLLLRSQREEDGPSEISRETAQLRAELAAIKDRLATVERIVTDGAYRLDREIEGLRGPGNGRHN